GEGAVLASACAEALYLDLLLLEGVAPAPVGCVPCHCHHVCIQIFTNKCLKPGCKQKEMMKVICDQCHKNYCLKHRHPLDHDCSGAGCFPLLFSKALAGQAGRAVPRGCDGSPLRCGARGCLWLSPGGLGVTAVFQSEEEALQRALEMSLADSGPAVPRSTQEEEDLALAQALSASEAEYQQLQRQAHGSKPSNCSMS
uniref:AN1-type domain-containing protein n=1 Tax=Nothoprocta perdicaria TaxID=30464 RepID=A0A8C6ZB12_NOTPE